MTAKDAAQRKAEERARKRKAGFKPREIWVHDDDWTRVQKYLERVNRRRS